MTAGREGPALERYTPAKKWLGYLALLLSALLVAAFALLLRADMRKPKTLNPADYVMSVPAGFVYEYGAETAGGALAVKGWACIEGERILTVDNWVVLYNSQSGEYLRLPTQMELDDDATEAIGGGIQYGRAGFTCVAPLKYLNADLSAYEICFAYRSNDHNYLVHTGEGLEGGGPA